MPFVTSASTPKEPLERVVSTHVDAKTIEKGYTVASHDERLRLGVRPNVLNTATRIDVKTLDPSLMKGSFESFVGKANTREGLKRIGDVYLYDIVNKTSYDKTDDFFLELKYPKATEEGKMHGRRRIYFYNKIAGGWQELPSYDSPETRSVRAMIHLPYARLAIFEQKRPEVGKASWYGYKNCLCAASPDYPKDTELVVHSIEDPDKRVTVRVNDYGPDRSVHPERVIDLDKVAYERLAPLWTGVIDVRVRPKK